MSNSAVLARSLEHDGFAILPSVVDASTVLHLASALEELPVTAGVRLKGNKRFGIRNLLENVPLARAVAESPVIMSCARIVLGENARLVRALFFDKPPEANWKVAWHQDLTIAVKNRVDLNGFGPWTIKAGVTHVQPPPSVLEQMLTLRIHLDDCDLSNGALKIIPGSHRLGRLTQREIADLTETAIPTICDVPSGGSLLMRPLLLHSSSAASRPHHRRVIHFEFSASRLPGGIQWYE